MSQTWIPFFSGDYDRDTKALSMLEHGAYFNLLRHVWSTGEPIRNHASACRIAYAIASEEHDAVAYILHKFFVETEEGFINEKAMKILAQQAEKSSKAAESAKKRWDKQTGKNANGDANAYAKANATEYANGYANQNQNQSSLLRKEYIAPSDSKKKKSPPGEEPQQYQELAAWFYEELLKRKPRTDKPNQNSWAKDLRLTCETDNRSIEEIKKALIWAHDVDSFWGRVCLSPDSLRRNWVKIWAAIDTKPKQPYQIHSTALPGNQITPAHMRQSGVIDIS